MLKPSDAEERGTLDNQQRGAYSAETRMVPTVLYVLGRLLWHGKNTCGNRVMASWKRQGAVIAHVMSTWRVSRIGVWR
jgi:hypothetical protein